MPGKTGVLRFDNAVRETFTVSKKEMQHREAEWQKTEPSRRFDPPNSAWIFRMTEELKGTLRLIRDHERGIRVWELLRDCAQRVLDETEASSERHEDSVESTSTVAKARAYIDECNAAILTAKALIDRLLIGDKKDVN